LILHPGLYASNQLKHENHLDADQYTMTTIKLFRVMVMVFYATFNNSSVISWLSVLLVEETRVPGENHQPAKCH